MQRCRGGSQAAQEVTPDSDKGKPEAASMTVARRFEAKILPPIKTQQASTATQAHAKRAKQLAQEQLKRRVDEIGASLTTTPGRPQSCDRLVALRRRVGLEDTQLQPETSLHRHNHDFGDLTKSRHCST